MKLIVLVKELSKLLLKYRFIKKESHNKNNNIKDLFLVKKKSFFLKEQTKNNSTIKIVLRFIIKLPNRKVIGNIDKKKQVLVMCAAGGRSIIAANLLANEGYNTLNVSDGFSGNGQDPGWKNLGLPSIIDN